LPPKARRGNITKETKIGIAIGAILAGSLLAGVLAGPSSATSKPKTLDDLVNESKVSATQRAINQNETNRSISIEEAKKKELNLKNAQEADDLAAWLRDDVKNSRYTFGGVPCSLDCSGHEAGYNWASGHDIDDPSKCEDAGEHFNSPSFAEGCSMYVDEHLKEYDTE
jgi:hypothetical protein